jgi:DNA-binding transcriptional LysR family regulator
MTQQSNQLLAQAFAAFSASRWSETIELCRQVLALEPDNNLQVYNLWASAELHGNHYYQILERIHRYLRPATYVEIGIEEGLSLAVALAGGEPGTAIVGIDPNPRLPPAVAERARIFRKTSDEFFARQDLHKELGERAVDLAFIDGMHLFEFALRDFINLERYCARTSTCLVHDCYPLDERTSARERVTEFWTGDVWKLVLCLKKYRPDLDVHTVAAAPTGLVIIRRLDPKSRILQDRLESICAEFVPLPYSAVHADKRAQLNLVANNWLTVKSLLKSGRIG